jgi:DnaJ-class molecular chaperone
MAGAKLNHSPRQEDLAELGLSDSDNHDVRIIRRAYFRLAKECHPDNGSTKEAFQRLSAAHEAAIDD